ncbi:DUF2975 domain-containing protein [Isoptericola sp. 4D.3]|uniref:DUF2975 domain-containing protein n=1 Tax=Isoptericola peretonis TaxID=2918523 RepID=A0ABT0J3M0_9MICO|nr:DUF2975 domain-containing protein [Isoptericola sp. 4D.3]
MSRTQRLVGPLRGLLVAVFAALVATQVVVLPAAFARMADDSPELAALRWPLLALAVVGLVCVEAVIVCTWRLLTMVRDDRIFSDHALAWVNGIVAAVAVAWVLVLAAFVLLVAAEGLAGLAPLLLLVLLVGAAVGLLVVVLRALLRQATELRTDLDGVI